MHRLVYVKSCLHRSIGVRFDDGTSGDFRLSEPFRGVAELLNDPAVFATAHAIDDGMAIGFDGCSYDICAQAVYELVAKSHAVGSAAA
jgi:hypothetical protein